MQKDEKHETRRTKRWNPGTKRRKTPQKKTSFESLTHLSVTSHKRETGKHCRPWSDAAERDIWSESTLFALNSEISAKHDNDKKLTRHPL